MKRTTISSVSRAVVCSELESRRLLALANLFTDTTLSGSYYRSSAPVLHAEVNGDGIVDLVAINFSAGGLVARLGNGNGTFQPEVSLAESAFADKIVVADFNSDGRDDFLSYRQSPFTMGAEVLLSGPALAYTPISIPIFPVADQVIATDVNGDDAPDVIAVVRQSNQSLPLQMLLNHGDGTFAAPVELSPSTTAYFVAAADLNGDGVADLVVSGSQSVPTPTNGVGVLLGRGDGTFDDAVWQSGDVGEIFLDRANSDDHIDILQTNGAWIDVRFGDGSGSFSAPVRSDSSNGLRKIADLNNDGAADLIASQDTRLVTRLALGDGTFAAPITLKTGTSHVEFTASDLNADGNIDIALVTSALPRMTILFGDGHGGIQQPPAGTIPNSTFGPALADFNNDGLDDLVSLGIANDKRVYVAIKLPGVSYASPIVIDTGSPFTPTAFVPGDFTGDGNVDILVSHISSMTLLAGRGDGTFGLTGSLTPVSLGRGSAKSFAVDLDADGAQDIIGSGFSTRLYRSNRDGTFNLTDLTPGQTNISIASRDIDANGRLDVAAILNDGSIVVLLGQPDGSFKTLPAISGAAAGVIHLGRFDSDAAIDIVTRNGGTLEFRRGDGRGGFGAPIATTFSDGLSNIAIADIDDDGLDEVIANYDPPVVFDLRADGTFAPKTPIADSDRLSGTTTLVTDFNNDGRLDVATSISGYQNGPTFYLNVGQALAPLTLSTIFDIDTRAVDFRFDAVLNADSVDVTDLFIERVDGATLKMTADSVQLINGGRTVRFILPILADGDYRFTLVASAVVSNAGLASTSTSTATSFYLAGDANRDRAVNFDDLLILAQNYGQSGRTFSQGNFDYSADGLVSFDDLLLLAQRYGTSLSVASPAGHSNTRTRRTSIAEQLA